MAGHLTGLVPEGAERALLAAYVGTSLLFAGRKYTQAIKDDIGDKSVFMCAILSTHLLQLALSCTINLGRNHPHALAVYLPNF